MTAEDDPKGFTVHDPEKSRTSDLPRIDFSTFVLSLGASAMMQLGQSPGDDDATKDEVSPSDLAMARQTIDTLEMLQEKTSGNLDDEETKLLQSILYELRMAFVKAKG